MGSPVELEGIGVRLGDTAILRNLNLSVAPGESLGLVGANGSGKTTLLRVISTLLTPTSGRGRVLGASLRSDDRFGVRHRIGLIGHTPALYPQLSIEENIAFVARIAGAPDARVGEEIERVGLTRARHRRAAQCSHGMQRRVEFARVLITRPDLVLLDEAHAGLDKHAAALVAFIIEGVKARGGAAITVSHDHSRIGPLSDRLTELQGGALADGGGEME